MLIEHQLSADDFVGAAREARLPGHDNHARPTSPSRHRAHRATRVSAWVAQNAKAIELFYLPPYAPELNPDEYLNRDLQTTIRSGPIAKTATALIEKARSCMERIATMPERVRAYFKHEQIRYAQ